MEQDEPADPGNVGLLGAPAPVTRTQSFAHPIQESRLSRRGWRRLSHGNRRVVRRRIQDCGENGSAHDAGIIDLRDGRRQRVAESIRKPRLSDEIERHPRLPRQRLQLLEHHLAQRNAVAQAIGAAAELDLARDEDLVHAVGQL